MHTFRHLVPSPINCSNPNHLLLQVLRPFQHTQDRLDRIFNNPSGKFPQEIALSAAANTMLQNKIRVKNYKCEKVQNAQC